MTTASLPAATGVRLASFDTGIGDYGDSAEDDADVVLAPNKSPANHYNSNPIVKVLLENRKLLDPKWALAAESVFSAAHPFTVARRNRSQEPPNTQHKLFVPSPRSSSESKCSSPKTKRRNVQQNENKSKKSHCEVNVSKKTPTSACTEITELSAIKSDSPKSTEETNKQSVRKKSVSMTRHRHTSLINAERILHLKAKVDAAIREHKVYSMTGHYSSVRKALKQRGWVEKIDSDIKGRRRAGPSRFEDADEFYVSGRKEMSNKEASAQCEAEIVNRMLRNVPEDLCWLSKPYPYCWRDTNKCDMVNRLPKAYFSNKVGLANALTHMQWYYEEGVCFTQYPRTYNISLRDELEAFQEDFRLTACVSTLKWLVCGYHQGGEGAVRSPEGRVDTHVVDFALRRCAEYVQFRQHDDIDMLEGPQTWDHQWDHFLTQYYKLVHEVHLLREAKEDPPVTALVVRAQDMINQMRPYWQQIDVEGINNWWIVKPGGRCCGNGILIRSHLDHITAIVGPSVTRETRYVVQKYIERPLLIYNTKFDIRQWFLVTNVYPLTIWMYKESYLRFCSSNFSLKSTHESIHLCNNAVQRRYKNGKRDRNLPDENMWDCYTFQTYLKAIGYPDVWEDVIYPGMRASFVGALLASQDSMERRRNCFELYGADFMVSEQLTDGPWLIEINSNPAMDASTSVTARMCPQVLEDIVKVVVDKRCDKNASTGAFELAFKQNCPPIPPYLGMSLSLRGKKVYKTSSESKRMRKPNFREPSSDSEDSSISEKEENTVQKRCCTDFMQPIKNLREEITRLGRSRFQGDFLSVTNGHNSDSATNDTDTSRGSRMALEGKEIELKRKKNRKKRHKMAQRTEKRQIPLQKRKQQLTEQKKTDTDSIRTDYVKKNIESIQKCSINKIFEKATTTQDNDGEFLAKSQENLDIYKDYIFSGQCLEEYKANNKDAHHVLEALFRHQIHKMCNDTQHAPVIVASMWEPEVPERETDGGADNSTGSAAMPQTDPSLLRVQGAAVGVPSRTTSPVSLNCDSTSAGELSECDGASSSTSKGPTFPGISERETRWEQVLRQIERKENRSKNKPWIQSDFTQALNITAPDLMMKQRAKFHQWQPTRASMEYFREWKYKIDETRKNCEDMLTKLRHFKETNSRSKLQDVLQRRLEEDARVIRKMKRIRAEKPWGKGLQPRKATECGMRGQQQEVKRGSKNQVNGLLAISGESVSEVLPRRRVRAPHTNTIN